MTPNPDIARPRPRLNGHRHAQGKGLLPVPVTHDGMRAAGFWVVKPDRNALVVAILVPHGLTSAQMALIHALRLKYLKLHEPLAARWELREVWASLEWSNELIAICGDRPPFPSATFLAFTS